MYKKLVGYSLIFITILVFSSWSYIHQKKVEFPLQPITQNKHIAVIVPSYNNINWYIKNLDSILNQTYDNMSVIYIDDASTDDTKSAVETYLANHPLKDKVTFISQPKNQGALANIYHAVHMLDDSTIVITVDGDDWLSHNDVLTRINQAYQGPIWMTYGNYAHFPEQTFKSCCADIPQTIIDQHAYRRYPWCASHLRTFYAWLFKKIKKEDLCDTHSNFYKVTWDQAFMLPMLEMAAGKWKFFSEVLYIYNVQNPLNDFKVRLREQLLAEKEIRSKNPYQPL